MKNLLILIISFVASGNFAQDALKLNEKEYFQKTGLDVTFFSDYYPDGHQSGVTIIQHGNRVAANGDLRLEPSPGQWSPVPKGGSRIVDLESESITQTLWFPDSAKNRRGFNPVIYPEFTFTYEVHISAGEDGSFTVTVDLEEPLPDEWIGKAGFNLEFFQNSPTGL